MRRNRLGQRLFCQQEQANGSSTRGRKIRSKNALRLLPWETKYQYTLFHFAPKNVQGNTKPAAQNDINIQDKTSHCFFETTQKHLSSSSSDGNFCLDVDMTTAQKTPELEERLPALRSTTSKDLDRYPKGTSTINLYPEKQKCLEIKSKWYDDCFIEKLYFLDYLVTVPVEFKSKDRLALEPVVGKRERNLSQSWFKKRFGSGSFSYKKSDLDRLLRFNRDEQITFKRSNSISEAIA